MEWFKLYNFFGHRCLAFIFPGFCHVFGRFSYVKCDFTEMKSFSSGNRLLCLLFMHIRFQVIRIFSAFQDKLEHNYIVKVFVSTVEEQKITWVSRGSVFCMEWLE